MGWFLIVFFCFADACTSLESVPYPSQQECESQIETAMDAIYSVDGITFFNIRCEPVHG